MKVFVVLALSVAVTSAQVYNDIDEAKLAAEKDLAALGEIVTASPAVVEKAETQAMKQMVDTVAIPEHSDLTGIKVEMDKIEGVDETTNTEGAVKPVTPILHEVVLEDTQNEQTKLQDNSADVHDAKRAHRVAKHRVRQVNEARAQLPSEEVLGDASHNLLDDEDLPFARPHGTRPAAPQFGNFGAPQMPQMPQVGNPMGQMNLMAPDAGADPMSMGMGMMGGGLPSMGMGMPGMMGGMGAQQGMAGLPGMGPAASIASPMSLLQGTGAENMVGAGAQNAMAGMQGFPGLQALQGMLGGQGMGGQMMGGQMPGMQQIMPQMQQVLGAMPQLVQGAMGGMQGGMMGQQM